MCATCLNHLILLDLINLKSTAYKDPIDAIFSIPLLLSLSQVHLLVPLSTEP